MWQLLYSKPGIRQLARFYVLKIRNAEQLPGLRQAHHAILPKDAIHHVLLETLLPHRQIGLDALSVDIVPVDCTVLDYAY
uniref:MANGLED family protein n=1 Tax=Rhizophora mucronata TaxID=61149 RepID=A0A2P2L5I4_RHIMU